MEAEFVEPVQGDEVVPVQTEVDRRKANREFVARQMDQFQKLGPKGFLELVTSLNVEDQKRLSHVTKFREVMSEKEREELWGKNDLICECNLWMALMLIATEHDLGSFYWRADRKNIAELIFQLPGFVLAAHIHEVAARGYLRILLTRIWPDIPKSVGETTIRELIEMFRRREFLPMDWDVDPDPDYRNND